MQSMGKYFRQNRFKIFKSYEFKIHFKIFLRASVMPVRAASYIIKCFHSGNENSKFKYYDTKF